MEAAEDRRTVGNSCEDGFDSGLVSGLWWEIKRGTSSLVDRGISLCADWILHCLYFAQSLMSYNLVSIPFFVGVS